MSKGKPLLYVEYYDHGSIVGWKDDDEVDLTGNIKGNICIAVGWQIAEDKKFLCLGSFRSAVSSTSHVRQYIVKACIIKRRKLKIPL
jgi:hypothetical protein